MKYTRMSSDNWWVNAVGGAAAILFGLAALFWPGPTINVIFVLFGLFAIIYGVATLIGVYRATRTHSSWIWSLAIGILSLLVGLAVFVWPALTSLLLLYIIAFWAIIVGLFEVIGGSMGGRWLMVIAGAITLVFGVVLLTGSFEGATEAVMIIGVFAIIRGIIQLIDAFRVPKVASPSA